MPNMFLDMINKIDRIKSRGSPQTFENLVNPV